MAEESEDGQEKTEEPTSRKLEKAAEDGQVLTSKEMFVFISDITQDPNLLVCVLKRVYQHL